MFTLVDFIIIVTFLGGLVTGLAFLGLEKLTGRWVFFRIAWFFGVAMYCAFLVAAALMAWGLIDYMLGY